MNNRKKQTAAAMAVLLSIATIAGPLPVMAQEDIHIPPTVTQKAGGQRKAAPDIILPENLQAAEGTALKDVELPEHWTWADDSTIATAETAKYPARFRVDDVTYDYTKLQGGGYNAENHYVERMVAVTIAESAKEGTTEAVQKQLRTLGGSMPATYGAGDVDINEANFPDEAFRTWLGQQTYGSDGKLTQEEIANIKSMIVSGNTNIKDLTGIEHFTALTKLYCSGTGIISLNVSQNTKLGTLVCFGTKIESLDVSQNTELVELNCINTKIESLDVSQNTALMRLICTNTKMESLDVSQNTNLTQLDCGSTKIESLDVSQNTKLQILGCSSTGISSLDVSRNTELTQLYCSDTGIKSLDVSQNTALTRMDCSNTSLAYLNIGENTNLTTVIKDYLRGVGLEVTEDTFNMADKFAGINKDKITNVAGADYNSTTGVMSNYSIGRRITYTYACGTSSGGTEQTIEAALILTDGLPIGAANFPDEAFRTWLGRQTYGSDGKITQAEIANIRIIDVGNNSNIKDLTGIRHFTALTELDCGGTGIKSLDVSRNKALTRMDCSDTSLAYLNIGKNNNLTNLVKSNLKPVSLEIAEDTFNMADKFAGINKDKIKNVTGADYDSTTGVMSNYSTGTPITYTYACGTSSGGTAQIIDATLNLTDTRAESTISITANLDKTYDGNAVSDTPTVSTTGSTGAVSYEWERKKNAAEWEVINTAPKDAGTYRVTAILASDSNYKGATSDAKEFTISQADSTISVTANLGKTYDGDAVSATPTVSKSGSTGAVGYKWEKKTNAADWAEITPAPKDAGTYRVTATVASDANYKSATSAPVEFTIAQADSTISVTANLGKTYDGDAVSATPTVSKSGSTGVVGYKWEKKTNAADWVKITPAPKDAGTYRVTATVASDANYKSATSAPVEFTIAQADSIITITEDLNKTYDGNAVNGTPAVAINGGSGAVSYKWEKKTNAADWAEITPVPKDAGTYRVTATVESDSNYKGATSVPVEFTISQAANSWTQNLAITGWTYDDAANEPTAAAAYGTATFSYCGSETGTYTDTVPTDAGTWYVKAVVEETDNYAGLTSNAVSFEITKAQAPAITLPGNLSGRHDAKLSTVTLPAGWAWTDGDTKLSVNNTGYKARLTVDDSNYDYTGVEGYNSRHHYVERTFAVTVSEAENAWTGEPAIADWTYGATASEPSATAKYGTVTFSYSDSETGTFTPDKPTEAGTWYLKAAVTATAEYTGLNTVISFVIAQAAPGYTVPQGLEAAYGQTLADVALPIGFAWTDALQAVGNAGTNIFMAVFTPSDTKNYKTVSDIKVSLTVRKADNALTGALSMDGWTYGDTPATASVSFAFGTPRFRYADRADGTFTDTVPDSAGTWYVKAVVDDTDNYQGAESEPVSFVIAPRDATSDSEITVPEITADINLDKLAIKDGDKVLMQGTDYDVTKTQDGRKVTVTITFKGNYTGTVTKTYTEEEKAPSGGGKDDNKADGTTTDNKDADRKDGAVQTGDTASMGLWSALLAFSAGAAVCLKRKKRKEETER